MLNVLSKVNLESCSLPSPEKQKMQIQESEDKIENPVSYNKNQVF